MSFFVKTTACYGPQSILYTYVLDAQEQGRSLPAPGAPWQNDVGDLRFPLRYGVVLSRDRRVRAPDAAEGTDAR